MSALPWRQAATLILVAPSAASSTTRTVPGIKHSLSCNYRTLLLKRNITLKFFPEQYVFPGGTLSEVDSGEGWKELYEKFCSAPIGSVMSNISATRMENVPYAYQNRTDKVLPPEVYMRIAAIREAFEEAGILLVRKKENCSSVALSANPSLEERKGDPVVVPDVLGWRRRVQKDPAQFLELCRTMEAVPDVWSLSEWSYWLTPSSQKKRFDTLFYIACLKHLPEAVQDGSETTRAEWFSPVDVIAQKLTPVDGETLGVGPPQMYEIGKMCEFSQLDQLHQFSTRRSKQGLLRMFPVPVMCNNGIALLLPGDGAYPTEPDYEGKQGFMTVDDTVENYRQRTHDLHRTEVNPDKGLNQSRMFITIPAAYGHVNPNIIFIASSKL